jgi:hypothetical protein
VKLRCYLLSLLRIHPLSCEHCKASEKCGLEMRERLEELNRRTQPNLLKEEIHREIVEGFDSKPSEVLASAPISSAQREKKAG